MRICRQAASLVTGEERDIDPQASVICSTIEMLDPGQHYAVGVIDEMQMIADTQRGWAWTQALFEMSADRLFVLCSPSVEAPLKDFVDTTDDTLAIHHSPLQKLRQGAPRQRRFRYLRKLLSGATATTLGRR